MTFVACYRRTMAGAKRLIDETPPKPTPKRDKLVAFYREQEVALARAREKRERNARFRTLLIAQSPVGIPILPYTSPSDLIAQVSFWSGIPVWQILGPSRAYRIVEARFDAMAAVAVNCRLNGRKLTLNGIGRYFGRDHSTVISALRQRGL